MRNHTQLAYDGFIPSGAGAIFTSTELSARLANSDALGIQVVIDNVSGGSPAFDLWIDHSADGRVFIQRNDKTQVSNYGAGTGDITWNATVGLLSTTLINAKMYSDACQAVSFGGTSGTGLVGGPLLSFVRFRMQFASGSGHVRVHVVHRDRGR